MLRSCVLVFLLTVPVFAQQPPVPQPTPSPQPQPTPAPSPPNPQPQPTPPTPQPTRRLPNVQQHWEINSQEHTRPTKHILFLIDSSGSMNGDKIGTAIEFVLNRRTGVAAAPFDDFYIALATFGSNVGRWEGALDLDPNTQQPISPYGWAAMPSEVNLTAARNWINNNLDRGSTNVVIGLEHSFDSCSGRNRNLAGLNRPVQIENLTILVITDGEFDSENRVGATIARLQRERRENNLPEAIIGFVGIQVRLPNSPEQRTGHTAMAEIAQGYGQLGYLRLEFREEEEED